MSHRAQDWLEKIQALDLSTPVRIMNVCGGHERSIAMAGLRSLLPETIRLIPGPGCPVCICPEEDIYQAIQWTLQEPAIVVSFGDMLRVPVNAPRGEVRSLEEARAAGADVRPIASPRDALHIAKAQPERPVIFHAVGFETTLAPIAALIAEGLPDNLFLLMSGRLTWPAVAMLLESGDAGLDALVAPGHVSTVMGPEEWDFVATRHHIPTAIAGFTPDSLLAATYAVLRQALDGEPRLENCYTVAVKPGGNSVARRCLTECFDVVDANWRGIGTIPHSGYALKACYAAHDARLHFPETQTEGRRRVGDMPPGCDCARVVLGKITPPECRIYGSPCTPRTPIGPCMVSDEGACRIWWASGIRERATSPAESIAA
ncbi:MAG: hydrogenase formation protein HypD [Gammaproteobacteria bacterium]|nr:hydrogenase formation protein HypD [Gammaproteobacteria bacterium]HRX71999.1 hydrogenase formation protein HypD [Candidatus Competibacteraceae bacterium]